MRLFHFSHEPYSLLTVTSIFLLLFPLMIDLAVFGITAFPSLTHIFCLPDGLSRVMTRTTVALDFILVPESQCNRAAGLKHACQLTPDKLCVKFGDGIRNDGTEKICDGR